MILHEFFHILLARIPSRLIRISCYFRESVPLLFLHRLALGPALSVAGTVAEKVRLQVWVRTGPPRRRFPRWLRASLLVGLVLVAVHHEMRTSAVQSLLFSRWAAGLTYKLEPGPSPRIVFPKVGPFDQRLGYTRIPEFERRLESQGYRVGDRHFGVITASVSGKGAGNFHFTSVLPVALLKLLAPAIETSLHPASGVVPDSLARGANLWSKGESSPFQSTSLRIAQSQLSNKK